MFMYFTGGGGSWTNTPCGIAWLQEHNWRDWDMPLPTYTRCVWGIFTIWEDGQVCCMSGEYNSDFLFLAERFLAWLCIWDRDLKWWQVHCCYVAADMDCDLVWTVLCSVHLPNKWPYKDHCRALISFYLWSIKEGTFDFSWSWNWARMCVCIKKIKNYTLQIPEVLVLYLHTSAVSQHQSEIVCSAAKDRT